MRQLRGAGHSNPTAHSQQSDVEHKLNLGNLKVGALHREMGVKPGKKLKVSALDKEDAHAKKDDDVALERRVSFALATRKWNHKK